MRKQPQIDPARDEELNGLASRIAKGIFTPGWRRTPVDLIVLVCKISPEELERPVDRMSEEYVRGIVLKFLRRAEIAGRRKK
jgi:hypothetical protein